MASDLQSGTTQSPLPREKPWLLEYNRRLRHLHGLTLRNLSLNPKLSRTRRAPIDDDGLPSALKSASKALALRESRPLEHYHSVADLRGPGSSKAPQDEVTKEDKSPPTRPSATRTRRRSTMEWSGASPVARQKRLEDVTEGRMAETFFSLHVETQADPIYVSEVAGKAMNPTFRYFDLDPCGPAVTRLCALTVKIWAKMDGVAEYVLLIEYDVDLRALQYIGKSLETFRQPFPPNCILFHLTDGVYTSFLDISTPFKLRSQAKDSLERVAVGAATSPYDALMQLSTLDDCIQDAINTRERLASEIEDILQQNKGSETLIRQVPEVELRVKTIEQAVSAQKKRVEAAKRQRKALQESIESRRTAIATGREAQETAQAQIDEAQDVIKNARLQLTKIHEESNGQRRRICEDLMRIYPIEPIKDQPLAFTIRGLALPNSDFDNDHKEQGIAAALGHVAKVVYQLALYMSVPLPYPIKARESTSCVEDPISQTSGPRTYPLFLKGSVRYRFEYGVFLLNKDIEILSNRLGLRLLDIRQTLPNLKYLLYVATAGQGELPARKTGGVRGLVRQISTPASDTESVSSTLVIDGEGHKEHNMKSRATQMLKQSHQNGKAVGMSKDGPSH
ncbi:hypothetical protein EJ05DRAFT_475405 [Pseudovirgaria hyperparasitica]|uniref:Autophagy-related protein 14 n=1 Tax=Pseudovirgaria hyperparasitica TaxID=470096 RepID=A0A6A6W944_9PEZI|nr:uncharacterized protein EJ05DRAFT_475405 [Pseudovirgaria hyperparasitica]KAF2759183.1 hypothetical protein EJ05DRAFT_475405 [Pseudovirgaria hyperparasitica]